MGVRWFGILPAVDIPFHHPAGIVDVTAVEARSMIDVFPDYGEMAQRSAVPLTSARDPRGPGAIFSPIQVRLLFAEIDDDGRLPGVALGNVRSDEIAHRVICAATAQSRGCERQGA